MVAAIVIAGVVWICRRDESLSPIVVPVGAPSSDYFDTTTRHALVAHGSIIGGGGDSTLIDPVSGDYRRVPGQVHTVSPDLRWAVVSVERPGVPQRFEFWLYDMITGRRAESLGVMPFTFVRWSGDGRRMAFVDVAMVNREEHCASRVRFVDVATGAVRKVSLDCTAGRDYVVGWTRHGAIILRNADGTWVTVDDRGHVRPIDTTDAYFGPGLPGNGSAYSGELRRRVESGEQIFLAPVAELWPAAAERATLA
ncbi:hypothetical protein CIK06_23635 [Plantactinospora sp. KBS50]|nr:hypothetical protein CIK06_23635 [Plantactinospora sp. KBS50]